MSELGKTLIFFGLILAGLGVLFLICPKVPFLGKLPGDIRIERDNFKFYFPLATSILLSLLFSLIICLFQKK